ncbi:MAG: hypothetical protein JJT75_08660 [Opitutales bacterium]|nr:hypothetical protein [Opitutales bacterium]MCH8539819.1 hypothetical protein [Opitutales bacterium]
MKNITPIPHNNQGSIILGITLLLLILAFAVGSFLRLAQSEMQFSHSSLFYNAAFNLAEGGVEKSIHQINSSNGFTGSEWTQINGYWEGVFTNLELPGARSAEIRIRVYGADEEEPVVESQGKVFVTDDRMIIRQIRAHLVPMPIHSQGIVAIDRIRVSGNVSTFDSYRSSQGPYGVSNRGSEITFGSISVERNAVHVGHATIYGYAATGAEAPYFGTHGQVVTYEDPYDHNENRVSTDFVAQFPLVEAPDSSSALTEYPEAEGQGGNRTITIGDASGQTVEHYKVSDFGIGGNISTLKIVGPVILETTEGSNLTGGNQIILEGEHASADVYAHGDLRFAGNSVANESENPANLRFFGIGGESQTIDVGGTAGFYAIVYAPEAQVNLRGNSEAFGSVVAREIEVNGGHFFHWDEDTATLMESDLRVLSSYEELTKRVHRVSF